MTPRLVAHSSTVRLNDQLKPPLPYFRSISIVLLKVKATTPAVLEHLEMIKYGKMPAKVNHTHL